MLKMAQQLALAEADLQQQEQQLAGLSQQRTTQTDRDQTKASQQLHGLQDQEQQCMQAACKAAAVLTSPSTAVLQLCRTEHAEVAGLPAGHIKQQGLWPLNRRRVHGIFMQRFKLLAKLAAWQDGSRMDVLASMQAQVSKRAGIALYAFHAARVQLIGYRARRIKHCADLLRHAGQMSVLAVDCRDASDISAVCVPIADARWLYSSPAHASLWVPCCLI
jgi:small-conductance mechanosensitive channel